MREPRRRTEVIADLITTAILLYFSIPPHERRRLAAALILAGARVSGAAARKLGELSIAAEKAYAEVIHP